MDTMSDNQRYICLQPKTHERKLNEHIVSVVNLLNSLIEHQITIEHVYLAQIGARCFSIKSNEEKSALFCSCFLVTRWVIDATAFLNEEVFSARCRLCDTVSHHNNPDNLLGIVLTHTYSTHPKRNRTRGS